jgi:hypothetical protein
VTAINGTTDLDKADILRVQLEALTADVHAVLADETMSVAAHSAEEETRS